VSIAKSRF